MNNRNLCSTLLLSACILCAASRVHSAEPGHADAAQAAGTSSQRNSTSSPASSAARPAIAWQGARANRLSQRAEMYYEGVFGVADLHVKVAESGQLIRFNY